MITVDGKELRGSLYNDPDNKVGIVIRKEEAEKINLGASCHRIAGKLMAVLEMRFIRDHVMILGKMTETPMPYFVTEEWGL